MIIRPPLQSASGTASFSPRSSVRVPRRHRTTTVYRTLWLLLATVTLATGGWQAASASPIAVTPAQFSGTTASFSGDPFGGDPPPYGYTNNTNDTGWIWNVGDYFTVDFLSPVALNKFRVWSVYPGGARGATWQVLGSNDGANFVAVDSFNYLLSVGGGVNDDGSARADYAGWYQYVINAAGTSYRYWRFTDVNTLDVNSINHSPRSAQVEFYGPAAAAPPGGVISSFNVGTGADAAVRAVAFQPDGRVLIGGSFANYQGTARSGIARVNIDGTLDTSFDPGSGTDGTVNAILVQANGQIVIGGDFANFNGTAINGVALLNADGSLDTSFDAGLSAPPSGAASALRVSADTYYHPMRRQSAQVSGASTTAPAGFVTSLSTAANGSLVIGGAFATAAANDILQAITQVSASTGLSDPAFTATSQPDGRVRTTIVQPDGKSLIGGEFTTVGGAAHPGLARLNADGSVDATFDPAGLGAQGGPVDTLALQGDGSVLVGGDFTQLAGAPRTRVGQIKSDGSLDSSFDPGSGADGTVSSIVIDPATGKALLGGSFSTVDTLVTQSMARLLPTGSADATFNAGNGANGAVYSVALSGDGSALVGGDFTQVAATPDSRLALIGSGEVGFLSAQTPLSNGVYFLQLPDGNPFGYYSFLPVPGYLYHFDLGYEYFIDAGDGKSGVYLYDFASSDFFYTSPGFPFPYLYDFGLNAVLYYYPDPNNPGRYNTNGIRYFYNFNTGTIITK